MFHGAGAQLADMELKDVAAFLVDGLTERQRSHPGAAAANSVVFFQSAGTTAASGGPSEARAQAGWYVMDMHRRVMRKDRCPVAEADAFVLFDEAHCRGSDMKLRPDACAVLTLGPDMGREKLVQSAARMRQLEKRQTVALLGTAEVCRSIRETCGLRATTGIQPKDVVEWVLWNTAEGNAQVRPAAEPVGGDLPWICRPSGGLSAMWPRVEGAVVSQGGCLFCRALASFSSKGSILRAAWARCASRFAVLSGSVALALLSLQAASMCA